MNLLFPESAAWQRRRDVILVVLFVVASVLLVHRATRKKCGVLGRNQEFGAQFIARAADPYFSPVRGHRIHGPYPPSMTLMAVPLALIPTPAARIIWASLQIAALWLLFFICRGWCRRWWPRAAAHAPILYTGALLLVSRYLLRDMAGGGGNLLYCTLAVLGIDLSLRHRDGLAGLAFGLGLVLKPNLCLILLPFALHRKWRLLGAAGGATIAFFLLPGLYFGMGEYLQVAKRWLSEAAIYATLQDLHNHALILDGWVQAKSAMNQCLREAIHRLFRPPGDTGAPAVNLATLTPVAATWVARIVSLTLLLAVGYSAARKRNPAGLLLQALAMIPLCLLLSPITWKAHHTALLPLCFIFLAILCEQGGRPLWLALLLVIYYPVCNLLNEEILGKNGKNLLQAISLVTWAGLALLLAALLLLREKKWSCDGNHPQSQT